MTIFRKIPTGDIDLEVTEDGLVRPVMATAVRYVKQKIASRLKFFLGEWFRDQRLGVPLVRDVFIKNPDLDLVRDIFRGVIISVQEVQTISRLVLAYDSRTRTLGVEFDAVLVDGGVLLVRQPDPLFILNLNLQRAA